MSTPIPSNHATFSVSEILATTAGTLVRKAAEGVVGVGTDTRQDLRGALFVALSGERFDGHDFLDRAVQAGAHVLLVTRGRGAAAPSGVTVIEVEDTLVALGELGHAHRQRWPGRVVAVAGSAGKTTTRSLIARLLSALFPGQVHATAGNLNNRIGVPLTLLGLEAHHRFAVVEVGTNMPGEVALLARIVTADLAVLTLIDLEHTEGLGDLSGVAREEGAIFEQLGETGVAIGNIDDPLVRERLRVQPGRSLGYGERADADLRIRERALISPKRTRLRLEAGARSWTVESPLFGTPGALSVAAAALVCEELAPGRLETSHFDSALDGGAEPGRNAVRMLSEDRVLLDDTYNSNPASARQAIATGQELAQLTGGRLWLVLGEMRELGALSVVEHRALGEVAARSGASGVFAVGPETAPLIDAARSGGVSVWPHADAETVGPSLWPLFAPKDVVVVKASRGVRAERVVQHLVVAAAAAEGGASA